MMKMQVDPFLLASVPKWALIRDEVHNRDDKRVSMTNGNHQKAIDG